MNVTASLAYAIGVEVLRNEVTIVTDGGGDKIVIKNETLPQRYHVLHVTNVELNQCRADYNVAVELYSKATKFFPEHKALTEEETKRMDRLNPNLKRDVTIMVASDYVADLTDLSLLWKDNRLRGNDRNDPQLPNKRAALQRKLKVLMQHDRPWRELGRIIVCDLFCSNTDRLFVDVDAVLNHGQYNPQTISCNAENVFLRPYEKNRVTFTGVDFFDPNTPYNSLGGSVVPPNLPLWSGQLLKAAHSVKLTNVIRSFVWTLAQQLEFADPKGDALGNLWLTKQSQILKGAKEAIASLKAATQPMAATNQTIQAFRNQLGW